MEPRKKEKNRWCKPLMEWTLLGLIVLVIYRIFAPEANHRFPPITQDDLAGVWTTTADSHRDRFLQFNGETITFGLGNGEIASYRIDDVASTPEEFTAKVRIEYTDLVGTPYQFGFTYLRRGEGMLRMKTTKQDLWERQSTEILYEPEFR